MVRERKKTRRKDLRVTPTVFEKARAIRKEHGISDSDIFAVGLDAFKPDLSNKLHTRFKFGKGQDNLVQEEYQGNAENISEAKRAKKYFLFSDLEWADLPDASKLAYIARLPPKKVRAGGEELSDRDIAGDIEKQYSDFQQDGRDKVKADMIARTAKMEEDRKKYEAERGR